MSSALVWCRATLLRPRAAAPLAAAAAPHCASWAPLRYQSKQAGAGGAKGGKPGGAAAAAPQQAAPKAATPPPPPAAAAPSSPAAPSSAAAEGVYIPHSSDPLRPRTMVVQLRLKSFHAVYLSQFVLLFADRMRRLGLQPPTQAFLPKKVERWTVLRSPHVDKKARDQFERITHKRMLTVHMPTDGPNVELAYRLLRSAANISAGVQVRARYLVSAGGDVIGGGSKGGKALLQ
jgi:small subunit ribosomal protein S10